MADRQEEFLEKLETVIRNDWENQLLNPFTAKPSDRFFLPIFWGRLVTFLKVLREENSVLVYSGLWKSRKAKIAVEKLDNNLKVVSAGFEPRRLTQVVVILLIVSLLVFSGTFLFFYTVSMIGLYAAIWTTVISEGILIVVVILMLKLQLKQKEKYNQTLRVCIELAINFFKNHDFGKQPT